MKTNISILTPSLVCGGAERAVSILANYIQTTEKYQVYLYVLIKEKPFYYIEPDIKIIYIDEQINNKRFLLNYKRSKVIRKLNNINSIDLIIGYSALSSIIACMSSIFTRVSCIICELSYPKRYNFIFKLKRFFLYFRANGAVHQTEYVKKYFSNIIPNGTVIQNMLEINNLPDIIPFKERKNKIVSVGRLDSNKNHEMLIRSFHKISKTNRDWIVEIYGEGELRAKLTDLIKELHLEENVFLKGNSNKVLEEIKDSKIFVLTSRLEGYPNALLEALSLGLICISTDCPSFAPREMLREITYSKLISIDSVRQLADTLEYFINLNIDDKRLINEAETTRKTHEASSILKLWLSYIESIINS